jgi:hypothetical protein
MPIQSKLLDEVVLTISVVQLMYILFILLYTLQLHVKELSLLMHDMLSGDSTIWYRATSTNDNG